MSSWQSMLQQEQTCGAGPGCRLMHLLLMQMEVRMHHSASPRMQVPQPVRAHCGDLHWQPQHFTLHQAGPYCTKQAHTAPSSFLMTGSARFSRPLTPRHTLAAPSIVIGQPYTSLLTGETKWPRSRDAVGYLQLQRRRDEEDELLQKQLQVAAAAAQAAEAAARAAKDANGSLQSESSSSQSTAESAASSTAVPSPSPSMSASPSSQPSALFLAADVAAASASLEDRERREEVSGAGGTITRELLGRDATFRAILQWTKHGNARSSPLSSDMQLHDDLLLFAASASGELAASTDSDCQAWERWFTSIYTSLKQYTLDTSANANAATLCTALLTICRR